jgi:hypothetical protein
MKMIGRRSVLGIVALVALALCAFGASSASAAPGRAFTCAPNTETGKEQFSDAHCKTAATGNVGFKHVAIANGTETKITGGNAKTNAGTTAAEVSKLKGKIAGVATEVQCTTVENEGTAQLTNSATDVSGTGTIKYSGCTVTLPAGRNCVVTGGTVTTQPLKATTVGLATNKELKFEPVTPTKFADVNISGCLNNVPPTAAYPVNGTLIAEVSGATTTTTHEAITTQATLTFGGNPAGLQGAITISMEGGNPITLT